MPQYERLPMPAMAENLADLFNQRSLLSPLGRAFIDYRDGDWQSFTWEQTRAEVARWQAAMLADGLASGDRIAIMCNNVWEWVLCDQAALGLGLVTVPIYTNDRPDNIAWILRDSGAQMLMLQSRAQWTELQPIHAQLTGLTRVLCLEPGAEGAANLRSLCDWLPETVCTYGCEPLAADSLATIVYTSGTTGRPKGVMLSHRNILFNVRAILQVFPVDEQDLLLSFLPLSHAFERTVGYYAPMAGGASIAYNRGIPQLAEDLQAVRPNILISVPRIFERVHGKIMTALEAGSALKRRLFHSAVDIGWAHFQYTQGRAPWQARLLLRGLFDLLVARKVRARLGGRLRFTVCGGAALNPDIARVFIGLGIPVVQGYGLTETSPVITANPLDDNEPASVGTPLPGIEIRVSANDELLTRSPSVMLGYWNNPDATSAIIDAEGWLHTGDKVMLAANGHVRITGRMKDIIVLATGEKVPPADMENAIAIDELVDQVLVIGEGRPYLSALLVPNPEAFERVAHELQLDPANEATCCDDKIRSLFMRHIEARIRDFPGYAQIRQVAVIKEPWTADNGLATPTMKLRRTAILDRYGALAERLYAGH